MKKVVIIGAGPAGLTMGYELLKQDEKCQVLILEASNEIGGISRTVQYNGNRMDIGGHRFFSKIPQVTKMWEEIMPMQGAPSYDDKLLGREKALAENGPDPEKDNNVMLIRQRVSRIYYRKKFFDYPVKMNVNTLKNMGLIQTISAGFSYLYSLIFKKEENSLENFYMNRFGKKLYSMFFEGYTEKLWGRHPSVISADWGAQRVKGLSIVAILKDMFGKILPGKKKHKVETSLIEEFVYPKYGPGQLWERVATLIEQSGGTIQKNAKVTRLHIKGDEIKAVTVSDDNGNEELITGDIFVSSMPVKDLINSMDIEVPKEIGRIANGLPYRDFVTIGLYLDGLNLKNHTKIKTLNNIIPDCWIYVQDTGVKLGRIQVFNNWSPYLVNNPAEKVWIGLEYFCEENDDFWNMSEEECVEFAINELIQMDIISRKEQVLDSHRVKVQKAYPAYFDTYEEIGTLIDYLNTYPNLYCIGRNGQHRYNNMDHSMVTAFEAVKCIKNKSADRSAIWNVNTEAEYHEEV